ncbi:TetR/AcrR family transcriptional regulator [Pseudonocardia sp. GCM10023141]|uniref:TetR/AcrR family transcriptional regulator n=1 Tax=Pseudonocardia sp. GCM10023141 TaxID=3252653 RepID=UPI00360FAF89
MTLSRAERSDARRADIVAAAARLFRRRGFAGVGIDDIGAAVGITGPGVYRHFTGKQAVLAAIVNGWLDQVDQQRELLGEPLRSSARRGPLLQATITAGLHDPDALVVALRQTRHLEPAARARVAACRAELTRSWETFLPAAATGGFPTAPLLLQACGGVVIGAAFSPPTPTTPRAELAERLVEAVLHTVLPPSAAAATPDPEPPRVRLQHASRREAVLAAASELFRRRGYAAVSLRDIGTEVGITASAVNRHFASKDELLAAMSLRASEQIAAGIAAALAGAHDAAAAVEQIIGGYVRIAIEHRDLIVINTTEVAFLAAEHQERRRRNQRSYVAELRHVLLAAHPRMPPDEATLRTRAAFALVNEVITSNGLARRPHLDTELTSVATAVLAPGAALPSS